MMSGLVAWAPDQAPACGLPTHGSHPGALIGAPAQESDMTVRTTRIFRSCFVLAAFALSLIHI
jgi:hypothetical protein